MLWNNNYNIIESIDQRVQRGAPNLLSVEYLIVGGGAAGSVNNGALGTGSYAGGNAGGFRTGSINLFQNTAYTVFVGNGGVVNGAPATGSYFRGLNYTSYIDLTVSGGSSTNVGAPQTFTPGVGDIAAGPLWFGGGGASGMRNGYNGSNPNAGNGGDALQWFSGSYCGGGGGGTQVTAGGGLGGNTSLVALKGGGGNGASISQASTPGRPNSGGGGGAAGNNNANPASNGGSGIVVIRYLTLPEQPGFPLATGGQKYTEGLYTYHRFISGSGEFRTYTL